MKRYLQTHNTKKVESRIYIEFLTNQQEKDKQQNRKKNG